MRFEEFARANGVLIDRAYPVDKIQSCGTVDHPRSQNGRWWFDGERGWIRAWDNGAETMWFNDPSARPWSAEEKRQWEAKRLAHRSELAQRQERAAQNAQAILLTCKVAPHGYLRYKGLGDVKTLVTPDDRLFVPMRNVQTNELQGAQVIYWDESSRQWVKKMTTGMKAAGAVLRLGRKQAAETILVEGYATGLSVEMAVNLTRLDASVLVCFSDGNLVNVAPMVGGRVLVFADNDESGAGERAAIATGKPYCMADRPEGVKSVDANDLHETNGIYAVGAKLMAMRRQEVPAL